MNRLLLTSVLCGAFLLSVHAYCQVDARFLGGPETDSQQLLELFEASDCRIGNLRAPSSVFEMRQTANALTVELNQAICGCTSGWMASEIHVLVMNMTDQQLTTQMDIFIDGQGPPHPSDPISCPIPPQGYWDGDMLQLLDVEVVLPHPGFYELVFPVSTLCAEFGHTYFIEINNLLTGSGLGFLVDDEPRACTFLYFGSMGSHWWWLEYPSDVGSPVWWIEAQCCEPAVATESTTWGHVKALYR